MVGSLMMVIRLMLAIVLSSLFASGVSAHEINPTVADLEVAEGRVLLELRLNAEAVLAGINLSQVTDTDDVAGQTDYESFRALDPVALGQRIRLSGEQFLQAAVLQSDAGPVVLEITGVEVAPAHDPEAPRTTRIGMTGALPGGATRIELAWATSMGGLILRQQGVEDPYTGYLEGGQSSPALAIGGGDAMGGWASFAHYVPVGFDHILPKGLDHILFVLGLFFLSSRLRPLVWQISAFTAAHTVTLAMGALGWVNVPANIVEPLIAASICYVAVENILRPDLSRWRPLVVFGFGLLHGLGFASVLEEFGLPDDQFVPTLLGFNVGVEIGQLTVIALAFLLVGIWRNKPWYRDRIAISASVCIALVGAYWFVERVFF